MERRDFIKKLFVGTGVGVGVAVAEFFGVSRMTVYSWFRGKSTVSGKFVEKVNKILVKFK